MKVKVISSFIDKFNDKTRYEVGMVVDFDTERAKNLIVRELAEAVEEEKPQPVRKTRKPKTED